MKNILILAIILLASCTSEKNTKSFKDLKPDELFYMQRAYPYDYINQKASLQAKKEALKMINETPVKSNESWESVGPLNIGGRVTDIARHPSDAETFYIGCSVGGVWKTTDGGNNWRPIFDDQPAISIGDLALSKSNPDIIYVGTGESNGSASSGSFFGTGVYRSDDGGETWNPAGLDNSNHIGRLVIDDNDPNTVYAATTGVLYGNGPNRGLYKTTNGGQSWEHIFFIDEKTACIDVVVNPNNSDIIYAAMWERERFPWVRDYAGLNSGIYKTEDGGENWRKLSNGLPNNLIELGRIGLTMSKTNPDKLYACTTINDITNVFEGLYKTEDGGESWERAEGDMLTVSSQPFSSFGWFFGNVRVDPENDDKVALLGLHALFTESGGDTWRRALGMHVDMHALEFFDGNSDDLLVGNDGGLYRSLDGGQTFQFISNIPITQIYNMEVDPENPEKLFVGTQDNNTQVTFSGNPDEYVPILGGDGFHVLVDPNNTDLVYAEYQWGNLHKSTEGGENMERITDGLDQLRTNWNSPIALSPVNSSVLFYGSHKLHRSFRGENWDIISDDLTKGQHPSGSSSYGTITTIAPSYQTLDVVYVGTDDGEVALTLDGGDTWTSINNGLPDRYVTEIAVNPNNDAEAIVTLSGYRNVDYQPHVLITNNYGNTWTDISNGLPEVPANDIEYHHEDDNLLYLGTDAGMWFSNDKGQNWSPYSTGMPFTIVTDLKIHAPTNNLYASTYGRSMYKRDIGLTVSNENIDFSDGLTVFPNPVESGQFINVKLENNRDFTNLKARIFNAAGQIVQDQNFNSNQININVESGMYILEISNGQKLIASSSFIVN